MAQCHLVKRFRQQRPEIPVVVGAAHAGSRIALDSVVEIGKAQRISEEEHRGVVAHDVPVALFGIELQREAADIALGVGGAAFACDGGEASEHRGLLADLRKDLGLGVAPDVVRDGKGAVGAGALGVHAAFGNHLAGEMGELLDQPTSCNSAGPRGPAVWMLRLSVTGVPEAWASGGRLESLLIELLQR
jgi:hypothetical protein